MTRLIMIATVTRKTYCEYKRPISFALVVQGHVKPTMLEASSSQISNDHYLSTASFESYEIGHVTRFPLIVF